MKVLVLDTEVTTFQKGNPFSEVNTLQAVGLASYSVELASTKTSLLLGRQNYKICIPVEHSPEPYGPKLEYIKEQIESHDLIVGFNIKFDLHWIRKYIHDLHVARVWDSQLCEFILSNQQNKYPSLDDACDKYSLDRKLDVVKLQYWDNGIDTSAIPWGILRDYNLGDLDRTWKIYREQERTLPRSKRALFELQCEDLLVLQEIEENGLWYDEEKIKETSEKLEHEIAELDKRLDLLCGVPDLNWASNHHISAVLFGGVIKQRVRVSTARTLKDGTVKHREKWGTDDISFEGLFDSKTLRERRPQDRNSILDVSTSTTDAELGVADKSVFSCDEFVLQRIINENSFSRIVHDHLGREEIHHAADFICPPEISKGAAFIQILLLRKHRAKLLSTYLLGIPALAEQMKWEKGFIFPSYQQCAVVTGRLAGNRPNPQNIPEEFRKYISYKERTKRGH